MRSVHPHWLANLRGAGRGDAGLRLRPLAVVAGAVAALLVGFVAPAAAGAGYHYDAAAAHVAAGTTAGHGGVVAAGPAAAAVGADAAGVQLRLTVDGVAPSGVAGLTDDVAGVAFRSDTSHIFRDSAGHLLEDTAANRSLLQSAIEPGSLRSTITLPDGSSLAKYFRTLPDGTQVWAEVRNGVEITNGGLNAVPR